MNIIEQIRESNMIEGIFREPLEREIIAHRQVLALEQIAIDDLEAFVSVYQPNAQLRAGPGMNVTVGAHRPPPGGISIVYRLDDLLTQVNSEIIDPWTAHVRYECLHPFTDGNGRSGRVLWYWMMRKHPKKAELGFLHAFYYQTLEHARE